MKQRFRLFPIVIVTAISVLGFKIAELARNELVSISAIGEALAQEKPAEKKAAKEASQMDAKKTEKKAGKDKKKVMEAPREQVITNLSQSQIALLEALSSRRKKLDERENELDIQKNLLKAAEKRIDGKISALEKIKDEIETLTKQQKKNQNDKFRKLVTIYEGMKPKEAARIFSQLDSNVVLQVAERIAPRKMSAILAKMDAEAAQRLTIQLATKAAGKSELAEDLPRIDSGNSG